MRTTGLLVLVLGLALAASGLVLGFGSLAAWNGRNTIAVVPLELGATQDVRFPGRHGRRYWFGVQAQVERTGTRPRLHMPIVLALRNDDGDAVLQAAGWFGPDDPPTTSFGSFDDPPGQGPVILERLLGAYPVMATQELHGVAELGPDADTDAHVAAVRLVVYDDAVPTAIAAPFAVAGLGALATVSGVAMVVFAWFRGFVRGKPRKGRARA